MGDYWAKREALISTDRASRVDSDTSFSDIGKLVSDADAIIRGIRAEEALEVWGPEAEAAQDPSDHTHLFPGMAFLTGTVSAAQALISYDYAIQPAT